MVSLHGFHNDSDLHLQGSRCATLLKRLLHICRQMQMQAWGLAQEALPDGEGFSRSGMAACCCNIPAVSSFLPLRSASWTPLQRGSSMWLLVGAEAACCLQFLQHLKKLLWWNLTCCILPSASDVAIFAQGAHVERLQVLPLSPTVESG